MSSSGSVNPALIGTVSTVAQITYKENKAYFEHNNKKYIIQLFEMNGARATQKHFATPEQRVFAETIRDQYVQMASYLNSPKVTSFYKPENEDRFTQIKTLSTLSKDQNIDTKDGVQESDIQRIVTNSQVFSASEASIQDVATGALKELSRGFQTVQPHLNDTITTSTASTSKTTSTTKPTDLTKIKVKASALEDLFANRKTDERNAFATILKKNNQADDTNYQQQIAEAIAKHISTFTEYMGTSTGDRWFKETDKFNLIKEELTKRIPEADRDVTSSGSNKKYRAILEDPTDPDANGNLTEQALANRKELISAYASFLKSQEGIDNAANFGPSFYQMLNFIAESGTQLQLNIKGEGWFGKTQTFNLTIPTFQMLKTVEGKLKQVDGFPDLNKFNIKDTVFLLDNNDNTFNQYDLTDTNNDNINISDKDWPLSYEAPTTLELRDDGNCGFDSLAHQLLTLSGDLNPTETIHKQQLTAPNQDTPEEQIFNESTELRRNLKDNMNHYLFDINDVLDDLSAIKNRVQNNNLDDHSINLIESYKFHDAEQYKKEIYAELQRLVSKDPHITTQGDLTAVLNAAKNDPTFSTAIANHLECCILKRAAYLAESVQPTIIDRSEKLITDIASEQTKHAHPSLHGLEESLKDQILAHNNAHSPFDRLIYEKLVDKALKHQDLPDGTFDQILILCTDDPNKTQILLELYKQAVEEAAEEINTKTVEFSLTTNTPEQINKLKDNYKLFKAIHTDSINQQDAWITNLDLACLAEQKNKTIVALRDNQKFDPKQGVSDNNNPFELVDQNIFYPSTDHTQIKRSDCLFVCYNGRDHYQSVARGDHLDFFMEQIRNK